MARKATGQVLELHRARGTVFALRFRAYGRREYITLGAKTDGWTRGRAEAELANVLADVRRGIWQQEPREPEVPAETPTFHEFATDWFRAREQRGLRPRTLEHDLWALSTHLLPHFHRMPLPEITPREIDRYMTAKAQQSNLSNRSINKTLQVLSAVLETAVEYALLESNSAKGRRRRLPETPPARRHLEPIQVEALLDAAADLDAEDPRGRRHRRPLIATLAYAGLRVGELLAIKWGDVDLAGGQIQVRQAKTPSGVREVDIQPELRDVITFWKVETAHPERDDYVFPTSTGKPENRNNLRRRVLMRTLNHAREKGRGLEVALPNSIAPHDLRRTFASWLIGEGQDVAYVMDQLGHTDPKMTLGLYAKALKSKRRREAIPTQSLALGPLQHGQSARPGQPRERDSRVPRS
jgi:integrase